MKFSATVRNSPGSLQTLLKVGQKEQSISVMPKPNGGSSVSGGELLLLALATCYCNDIYREADKRNIHVESVKVEVNCEFEAEGKPATNITYRARIKADADEETVRELLRYTDTVAEVQNTLRAQTSVNLEL
jgi:uncharacterized OsmC-like protein